MIKKPLIVKEKSSLGNSLEKKIEIAFDFIVISFEDLFYDIISERLFQLIEVLLVEMKSVISLIQK